MLGETIGSYRITGKLSEGGMGVVYRAEHVLLGRPAAIKLILPIWSENRDIVERFFDEARVTSTIRHPGIVEIFDFGYHGDGRAYLVMELLAGQPLSQRLSRGPVDELGAVLIARSVAGALAAAHARGVVHRDLKPDNIFLVPDPDVATGERPKVLDFGIAKLAGGRASGRTATGAVMGTPAYMSPEQCRGTGDVDARADLYSLGCILYELVSGRLPFAATGSGELIAAHLMLPPEPLRPHAPALSPALEALIMRLLAKDPAARPASSLEVAAALSAIAADAPGPAAWKVMAPTPMPPTVLATPTTLGGAAGATRSIPPATAIRASRARWWPALAAAATLAAVALAIVAITHRGSPTDRSAAPPAPTIDRGAGASDPSLANGHVDAGGASGSSIANAPTDAGASGSSIANGSAGTGASGSSIANAPAGTGASGSIADVPAGAGASGSSLASAPAGAGASGSSLANGPADAGDASGSSIANAPAGTGANVPSSANAPAGDGANVPSIAVRGRPTRRTTPPDPRHRKPRDTAPLVDELPPPAGPLVEDLPAPKPPSPPTSR